MELVGLPLAKNGETANQKERKKTKRVIRISKLYSFYSNKAPKIGKLFLFLIPFFFMLIALLEPVRVEAAQIPIPGLELNFNEADSPEDVAVTVQILLLLTVLSLAPAILIMLTSFTRIVIVLGFIRRALATQTTPPNQVIIGLALFLTLFTMRNVVADINQNAFQPYLNEEINQIEAFENAMEPIREFMFRQTRQQDLAMFMEIADESPSEDLDTISNTVLIPAFIISELKTAFQMGFVLFIPFIVLDMVIASTLLSMGMMMLPPAMISLPFKLLLFIMVDGWNIIIRSLVGSFN
ncbi:flagellar type III secretion system pore protein FliP [Tindallia californiensis]|nr:flagellar type III secretion system pore protein FliP [Tindallia californiensis]